MASGLIHSKVSKHASDDVKYHCLYGYFFLGVSKAKLAKIYAKDICTISNWLQKFEETGNVSRRRNVKELYRKFDEQKRSWLINLYKEKPILYQREAVHLFQEKFGMSIGVSSISIILHEAKLTWKVLERRAIQIQMSDIIRFTQELASIDWMFHELVFLDEAAFDNADMLRRKGYAIKGQQLIFRGEFCRKARMSLLCFIGYQGIIDCYSTEGTFDRHKFLHFCRKFALDHAYQFPGKYSVFVMDGAAIHMDANITMYLRSLGIIVIYLPAYCPFFNPIELLFGWMKKYLKEIYVENSKEKVDHFIGLAVKKFMKKDLKSLFRKCGYLQNGLFDPAVGMKQKLEDFI